MRLAVGTRHRTTIFETTRAGRWSTCGVERARHGRRGEPPALPALGADSVKVRWLRCVCPDHCPALVARRQPAPAAAAAPRQPCRTGYVDALARLRTCGRCDRSLRQLCRPRFRAWFSLVWKPSAYRVHDDRGRPGGGVRDAGRPVGPRRHRRHRLGAPVPGRRSHHRRRPGVPDGDVPRGPAGQGLQDRQPGRGVRRTAGHRVAARAGVARNRGAQLRRLDLALRPRGDRPVANEGDADLRLVSGPAPGARIPPVPASQSARWPTRRTLR